MTTEERSENLERQLATARRIDLVNAQGQTRLTVLTVRADKDGPKLALYDKNDEWRAILYVNEDGPEKILFGEKGELREVLNVPTNTMLVDLYDAGKNLRSSFGVGDLPRIVQLRSAESKIQVVISKQAANLEFLLHDAGGYKRASLSMGKDRGRLQLFDENGKAIWSAPE